MTATIRVLLADDHALVRDGLRAGLLAEPDLCLVGEAADGHEAQRLCLEHRPDVLLLDLNMPGPSPFETVTLLREQCPETRVLALTAYDDDAYVRGLVGIGIAGYVLKDETIRTLVDAIRTVARGDPWFSQRVVAKVVSSTAETPGTTEGFSLTDRELEILRLIVAGKTEQEIGQALGIAERTVRYALRRIYDKLEVNSRIEAVVQAVRLRLVPE
jgi:DNA-binding NarL/FixJ family response regulator